MLVPGITRLRVVLVSFISLYGEPMAAAIFLIATKQTAPHFGQWIDKGTGTEVNNA